METMGTEGLADGKEMYESGIGVGGVVQTPRWMEMRVFTLTGGEKNGGEEGL